MTQLIEAIITKIKEGNGVSGSLYTLVGGRFNWKRLPPTTALPNFVFTVESNNLTRHLGGCSIKHSYTTRVRFCIFTNSRIVDYEGANLLEALWSQFDETFLSFPSGKYASSASKRMMDMEYESKDHMGFECDYFFSWHKV